MTNLGNPNYTVGIRNDITYKNNIVVMSNFQAFLQTMSDNICSTYVPLPLALLNTSIWSFSRTYDTLLVNGWFICVTIFTNRHTRFHAVRFCHKTIMDIWRAIYIILLKQVYILYTVFINIINYLEKKPKHVFRKFQLKT